MENTVQSDPCNGLSVSENYTHENANTSVEKSQLINADDNIPDDGNDVETTASDDSSDGKIFVGGIPWQTTEANLRFYFEEFGELEDFVIMKDRLTGKPRGFGFIKYKDSNVIERILSQKHIIDGRSVDVKRATPRSQGANASSTSAKQTKGPTTLKIFVGGLSQLTNDAEFRSHFEKYGTLKNSVVVYDKVTKRSRGFGFVEYTSLSSVEKCVSEKHELGGKEVEVKEAASKDQSQANLSSVVGVAPYALGAYNFAPYSGAVRNAGAVDSRLPPRGFPYNGTYGNIYGFHQQQGYLSPAAPYGYVGSYSHLPQGTVRPQWAVNAWGQQWAYQQSNLHASSTLMPKGNSGVGSAAAGTVNFSSNPASNAPPPGRADRSFRPY